MKTIYVLAFMIMASVAGYAQAPASMSTPDPTKKIQVVEAACGECKLGLKGKSCDLAVRIDGKSYFVDGTSIHDYDDAHGEDGFCNAISKAEVQGKIVGKRFKATYFKVIKDDAKAQ